MRSSAAGSVLVHGQNVRVEHYANDIGDAEARHHFGGPDAPASLAGSAAGFGTAAVLAVAAIAGLSDAYSQGASRNALVLSGLIAGVVVAALAALVAGWAAGRMSRYEGGRNGLLAELGLVVLLVGAVALLRWQDQLFDQRTFARWIPDELTRTRTWLTAVITAVVLPFLASIAGTSGARWHRRPDELIARTRAGGVTPYPVEVDR